MLALERALEGEPSFTVLCGASSVGKVVSLPYFDHHPYIKDIPRPLCYEKFFRVKNTTSSISIYG